MALPVITESEPSQAVEINLRNTFCGLKLFGRCGSKSARSQDRTVPGMKQLLAILGIIALLFVVLLCLPLLVGIWPPDIIGAPRHTLAERRLDSGHSFRVVQYWNHVDFYSTELHVTLPDGRTEVHTLDGDDNKSWRLPLVIDEQRHTATVTLSGGRVKKVDW